MSPREKFVDFLKVKAGGIPGAICFSVIYLSFPSHGHWYLLASFLGLTANSLMNFSVHYWVTFRARGNKRVIGTGNQLKLYLVVFALTNAVNMLALYLLVGTLKLNRMGVQAGLIVAFAWLGYVSTKWIFVEEGSNK